MQKRSIDYSLLIVTLMLVAYGLLMVFSSSYYMALTDAKNYGNDGLALFKKQLGGAALGIGAMILFMLVDYKKLMKLKYVFLAIAIIFLILVLTPLGTELNGASRWIRVFNISVQPLEIAKFSVVIFTAATIYVNRNRMDTLRYGILPNLIVLGVVCGLLLLQPNFSGVILLCVLVFIMIFVGGAKGWHLGVLGGAGGLAGFAVMMMKDYRIDRLVTFTDPWSYASDGGYQVIQSLYGIGAGGIFGSGIGNGRQKYLWLPYGESDYIFSITTEELGLIGAIVLIAMFIFFVYRGIKIAATAPDLFGTMLATGITTIVGIQVIINIGVVTATIPATGVPLPFVSYGNSSLVIFMAMVGILLNISRQARRIAMPAAKPQTQAGQSEAVRG
ncbi:putative lipid II flippase FtsW [Christensenellaceae bacterium OttesenSCG-928-K19]|nr:putative lipid II flippase FtsW [Christensenellaceae bacterium OttesenSCG-928-K19]